MKRSAYLIVLAAVLALFSSCLSRSLPEVSYYLLEYLPETEQDNLRQSEPLFGEVHIQDTELPRAFVRRQIVNRLEGPAYRYLRDHLWGSDLSEALPRLIESRVRAYRIFNDASRSLSRQRQEYIIGSRLDRIEFVQWGDKSEALVEVEFTLVQRSTEEVLVRHTARRTAPVKGRGVGDFVSVSNKILLGEIDAFLARLVKLANSED